MAAGKASANPDPPGLSELLEYLKTARGFDFTGYKRGTLERRIIKRMDAVGVDEYSSYRDHLEVNPDEFTDLFNTILINVTGFFRDKPAWDYLANEALPELLEAIPDDESIRVWSAGCASGEEPYTIAMVLAEALGEEAYRRRVKIYATDVDQIALATARQGVYGRDGLKPVPAELKDRYFEQTPGGFVFRGDLRRSVIFGRNDLVQDAPISRIDLLVSRNALMYFTAETQSRILTHFNFALNDSGLMFLGKSEMLITHSDLFVPESLKWRVFRRVRQGGLRERLAFAGSDVMRGPLPTGGASLAHEALESSALGQIVVDAEGQVVSANARARELFGLHTGDVGRPFRDLDVSFKPVELRAAIEAVHETGDPVELGLVPWMVDGRELILEISMLPLPGADGGLGGVALGFDDVTAEARLDTEHRRAKKQLEGAYDELQSTVEELETTNEELHSTNEELETTNEELQSTNEELETMNEELESTNHELETMNDDQSTRSEELARLTVFLEGVLESLGVGVVVVDPEQRVLAWNAQSRELWGLAADEAEGKDFMSLDFGLPVKELGPAIKAALAADGKATELTVGARSRRGKDFDCWVKAAPLLNAEGKLFGALLLMADAESREDSGVLL